jgi:hypothetical protein
LKKFGILNPASWFPAWSKFYNPDALLLMDDVLEKVVVILEEAESFIVPVKWVWGMLEQESSYLDFTVEGLAERLKKDRRFRLFAEQKVSGADEIKWVLSEAEQEKLGFYRGPRVMLKDRIPTRKEMVTFLLKKVDQTYDTLKQAWDIRPKEDEAAEDQLLEALAKAQKLQRELKGILAEEK